jgi:4-hydroxy-3-methylbut-2-en-1-yl diphosphate synthase IspG/GcpE
LVAIRQLVDVMRKVAQMVADSQHLTTAVTLMGCIGELPEEVRQLSQPYAAQEHYDATGN